MKNIILIVTLLCAAYSAPAQQGLTAKDELDRIWAEYQNRFSEATKLPIANYLKELEKLEKEAIRANDAIPAAAIRKERETPDILCASPAIPEKASPRLLAFGRLRADFDRKIEDTTKALNVACRTELERSVRVFLTANDPIAAAAITVEKEAVAKPLLHIVNASFGNARRIDITIPLRKAIKFNHLSIPTGNYLAGNPAPHQSKNTSVTFQIGSAPQKTIRLGETGLIVVP